MRLHGFRLMKAQIGALLVTCAVLLCACSPAAKPPSAAQQSVPSTNLGAATATKVPTGTAAALVTADKLTSTARVTLTVASDRLAAGSDQLAVVTYSNDSDKRVVVSMPLDAVVRITDLNGGLVSEWRGPRPNYPVETEYLAPGDTTYRPVRFVVPGPGSYRISGVAEDLEIEPIALTAVE